MLLGGQGKRDFLSICQQSWPSLPRAATIPNQSPSEMALKLGVTIILPCFPWFSSLVFGNM